MLFLKNTVKTPLKNKRVFSNFNNGCNLDIDTKKKIQIIFALTPSLYLLGISNVVLTAISVFN
jgi:hypothetical protein